MISAGRTINDSISFNVLNLIVDALNEQNRSRNSSKIAVLGLSYKQNVGDYRESTPEVLIEGLTKRGAEVYLVDPYVEESVVRSLQPLKKHYITWSLEQTHLSS